MRGALIAEKRALAWGLHDFSNFFFFHYDLYWYFLHTNKLLPSFSTELIASQKIKKCTKKKKKKLESDERESNFNVHIIILWKIDFA